MKGSETVAHLMLKQMAAKWARSHGYRACATEVRVPSSPYRADLAGYKPGRGMPGVTVIFECKQSRADFLRDAASSVATTEKLKRLHTRRLKLEELLKVHHPNLRRGETLFAEYDVFDLDNIPHRGYRAVMREVSALQERLYGKTKLEKIAQYRCANLLYVVTEPGILAAHEVPLGWGWLEREDNDLALRSRPAWQEATESHRLMLLESIAIAGTRLTCRIGLNPLSRADT
jgi:hypothetical protein